MSDTTCAHYGAHTAYMKNSTRSSIRTVFKRMGVKGVIGSAASRSRRLAIYRAGSRIILRVELGLSIENWLRCVEETILQAQSRRRLPTLSIAHRP